MRSIDAPGFKGLSIIRQEVDFLRTLAENGGLRGSRQEAFSFIMYGN
jgi:hypothetical protein